MIVLLLDFGKETATNLTIKYIGLGYEVFWTEDSRILAISISSSCKLSLIYNWLYICENERRGTVGRCSACNGDEDSCLPGTLYALQWVSANHYNACCGIFRSSNTKSQIAVFNVSIELSSIMCYPLEIVDYTIFRNIASFTPSVCFDRFHNRYFVVWKSSAAGKIFAISLQKFGLTSLMSSEKSDWPAVKSQIRVTYDKGVPIPFIQHQLDPNVNSVRFINEVISGPVNPSSALVACFPTDSNVVSSAYTSTSRVDLDVPPAPPPLFGRY